MTNNWQQLKIRDICELGRGRVISKNEIRENPGNYPVYSSQTTNNGEMGKLGSYDFDGEYITWTTDGAYAGTVFYRNGKFNCTNVCGTLKSKAPNIDMKFLAYYMSTKTEKHVVKTGNPKLMNNIMAEIQVLIPKIKVQNKIADILSSVDEAIKKTDQIIQKTELLKQGLMKELLVSPIKNNKSKSVKLGDIAFVERGRFSHRPRNDPKFYGGDIPFIQTGDVVSSNGKIRSYSQTLNEQGLKVSKLFHKGTIVLTIAANIGDTGILEFDACFPDSLVGIKPYEGVNPVFLEYLLRSKKPYLNSIATQSAQKNINLAKLNPLSVDLPSIEEQKRIAEILSSLDLKLNREMAAKESLMAIKKGLMQDIFSQKVQIN